MNEKVQNFLKRKIFSDINTYEISEKQLSELELVINTYTGKKIKNRLTNIYSFLKYGVDDNWLDRINIIITVLKNDVMSDYALGIRYGEKNIEKKKKENALKVGHSLSNYIAKYGDISGYTKWSEFKIKSKTPWGLKSCIQKFGLVDGKHKWYERLSKKIQTQKERKKIKAYPNGRTLGEYQNRYGVEIGYQKWLERNKKQSYRFSKEYYIDNFGLSEGLEKWDEYKKQMNKGSLKSFVKKYGIIEGNIKHKEYYENIKINKKFFSKSSQKFFWLIVDNSDLDRDKVKFGELNGEEIFYINNTDGKVMMVDFKYEDKIIEYDGDYWHNTIKQIEKDIRRDKYLISRGYKILRVRESECKLNESELVNKCINFLKEK